MVNEFRKCVWSADLDPAKLSGTFAELCIRVERGKATSSAGVASWLHEVTKYDRAESGCFSKDG